jgi:hypothetical protein
MSMESEKSMNFILLLESMDVNDLLLNLFYLNKIYKKIYIFKYQSKYKK